MADQAKGPVFRQAVAVIDKRTTLICLDVAGQTRDVDRPFTTIVGEFMHPPFHAHCRTMEVPWMPGFGTDLQTAAREEKATRPYKQRLKKNAVRIPGPED